MRNLFVAAAAAVFLAPTAYASGAGAAMIIHHAVVDYAKWRPVYDADRPNRESAGLTNCQVHSSADNANDLFVVCDMADVAKAKAFATSPKLAGAMANAGVLGKPDIFFLLAAH